MKKFELTQETITVKDHALHRIVALRTFGGYQRGPWRMDEKEENLSQDGDCWIYHEARVFSNARVYWCAHVYGSARICEHARIGGYARVRDTATVCGTSDIGGHAIIRDSCIIMGETKADCNVCLAGEVITRWGYITDSAEVRMPIELGGAFTLRDTDDMLIVGPIGTRKSYTVFIRQANGQIYVCCGCYYGSMEEFEARVKDTYPTSKHGDNYLAAIAFAKSVFA